MLIKTDKRSLNPKLKTAVTVHNRLVAKLHRAYDGKRKAAGIDRADWQRVVDLAFDRVYAAHYSMDVLVQLGLVTIDENTDKAVIV